MADASAEAKTKGNAANDSVKLLLSYIKQCGTVTINWQTIAEDCDITGTDGQPSKGAANKRFSRILKANGIDLVALKKSAADGGISPGKASGAGTKRKAKKPPVDSHHNSEDENESENKKLKTEAEEDEESADAVDDSV